MTADDESSVYVGGLPYDATEDDLRRAFSHCGAVVGVKVINDKEIGGRCYGFVTFTNPRSAVDAISDMDGRTIGGRTVKVNEVRTRKERHNFQHESFSRGRDRDSRDRDRDRDRYRDRINDHIHDNDYFRDSNTERMHHRDSERRRSFDRSRDSSYDRDRIRFYRDQESRDPDQGRESCDHEVQIPNGDWDREKGLVWDRDDMDKTRNKDNGKDRQPQLKSRIGERSSNSGNEYDNQVDDELEMSYQRSEQIQKELKLLNSKVDEHELLVSDLQKKRQKLEDAFAAAKKLKSQQHSMLTKLHRCFMQTKEYNERLISSEQELKVLVDAAMSEVEASEDIMYLNGQV